ncbi:MAG TPA: lipoyl synthase [Lentisphaeria bacterium]|nr:MAG: lipoyl synthase [Lentisphaerae bacterium GWF2_38_69]HBM15793.1 lipoyl synthase [Lentisphaeria bacterium]
MKEQNKRILPKRPRLPDWIRIKPLIGTGRNHVSSVINNNSLNTVCQSAKCPNLNECWHKHTATFMILGKICTRKCRFCSVCHGIPDKPDYLEPMHVAQAVKEINLKYVVITSVTRDDLSDGGAQIFADTIKQIRELNGSNIKIEVLTPDFNCNLNALQTVLSAKPTVFNHNIETVRRLTSDIRFRATYDNSLYILKKAFELSSGKIPIKSGLMVGLGETNSEVEQCIRDIRDTGATILTIGQYLPPSNNNWPLARYVHPELFDEWKKIAYSLGFTTVASAPLVRSSYCAEELLKK